MKTHRQDLLQGLSYSSDASRSQHSEENYWSLGCKDLPLNDSLVNTVTYYVRG